MNASRLPTNWKENWQASFILLLLSGMALLTAVMIGIPNNGAALGPLCVGLVLVMMAVGQLWHPKLTG